MSTVDGVRRPKYDYRHSMLKTHTVVPPIYVCNHCDWKLDWDASEEKAQDIFNNDIRHSISATQPTTRQSDHE